VTRVTDSIVTNVADVARVTDSFVMNMFLMINIFLWK
jgi:hypothetical protein